MKILVCMKLLPDPDRILDSDWDHFSPGQDLGYAGEDYSCFDRAALELALQLKEQGENVTCAALTAAQNLPESFSSALYAVGFDEVACIPVENREFRPREIGTVLALAACDLGADLILAGREAGMAQSGMVPYYIAQRLDMPLVAGAEEIGLRGETLHLRCRDQGCVTEREISLPAVVTVGNSLAVLRYPTLRARRAARDRQIRILPAPELAAQPDPVLTRAGKQRSCRMLENDENLLPRLLALLRPGEQAEEKRTAADWEQALLPSILRCSLTSRWGADYAALRQAETGKLILLPESHTGRNLALRLAEERQIPCIFDAAVTGWDGDLLQITRGAFGSNLQWTRTLALPLVVTVPEWEMERWKDARMLQLPKPRVRPGWLLREEPETAEELDQNAAAAVVCGMGAAAAREDAKALAEILKADFGMTRPAAMERQASPREIIGQSGRRIAPRCCLVLGAAGAGAFRVGIENAGVIIAVNQDPNALIFRYADYGILADAGQLTRRLLEAAKEEP